MNPLLARVLAVGGIAAAGWLLGGAGAALADDIPAQSPVELSAVTGNVQRVAEKSLSTDGVARRLDESTRPLSGSSLSETASSAGETARHTVENTADGAGGIVSGTLKAGEKVGSYADSSLISGEGALAESISAGLARPAEEIKDGLQKVVNDVPVHRSLPDLDLTGLPALQAKPEQSAPVAPESEKSDRADQDDLAARESRAPAASRVASAHGGITAIDNHAVAASRALVGSTLSAEKSDSSADSAKPGDNPWRPGADSSTGAVSSSGAPSPAAAGFLVHRADSQRLIVGFAVLPGDPTLVVRDATDDPSFSPD
ncbi:hypothetical protein [Nocardiopsis ansamitocini]|uniref:hypothetical protein n=1 Tax=Nocardiopsis ansamitocini TaxID=1670832 RepID=UPI0025556E07|nr:hypothetical protein [Nocardiopsis ansamitocini]